MKRSAIVVAALILAIFTSGAMATTYSTFDDMNTVSTWAVWNSGAQAISSVAGHDGSAVEWTYTGAWQGFFKGDIAQNWTEMETVRFWIRGTGAVADDVRVQATDGANVQASFLLPVKTNVADWTQVTVNRADFTGGSPNWAAIQKLEWMVGDGAGTGAVQIDQIEVGMPDGPVVPPNSTAEITVTVTNPSVEVSVTGSVAFGSILAGASVVSQTAVTVSNGGSANAQLLLNLTNPADWTASSTAAGPNQYILNAEFASAVAACTWSDADDALTTTAAPATDTKFAGDQTGLRVLAGTTRSLWFQFKAPTVVTNQTAHTIVTTVTAVAVP